VGHDLFIVKVSHLLSDTWHLVGFLSASDQPNSDTPTWQHRTITRDKHPYPWQDLNLQFQQASGCRPMP